MLRVVAPRKAASEPAARAALVAEPRTMSLPFIGADVGVSDRLLAATLAASIVLHAVVLALKFSPFDLSVFDRSGPPLEVALVNAKSKTKPTKAEILAQHHLDGGGNTDANRRAKTPLPVLPKESNSTELAVATQRRLAHHRAARVECADLRQFALPGEVDLVYAGAVFMYLGDAAVLATLQRIRAALAPDGVVAIRDLCAFNLGRRVELPHVVYRRASELRALAERAGLRCIETRA